MTITFDQVETGKPMSSYTDQGIVFALSRPPSTSRAAGRVMFFPHPQTPRKGILNAMASESIPVEVRFPKPVKSVTLVLWGSIGSKGRFSGQTLVPLDLADKIRCPMIVNFGEKDAFIPLDEVRQIEARLQELGKQAEVKVYPGADHGYMCSDRASYHAQAAKESWEKMVAFFGKHLK